MTDQIYDDMILYGFMIFAVVVAISMYYVTRTNRSDIDAYVKTSKQV